MLGDNVAYFVAAVGILLILLACGCAAERVVRAILKVWR